MDRTTHLLLVSAWIALPACSDIETNVVDAGARGSGADASTTDTVADAAAGGDGTGGLDSLWPVAVGEWTTPRWEPGSGWYDYDSTTHVLTPAPVAYKLDRGDGPITFRIDSYYDRRGESGVFRLLVDRGTGEEVLQMDTNIKQGPACVSLSLLREVPCDETADLIARTDFRPVPGAGFSVSNPAIYPRRSPDGEYVEVRVDGQGGDGGGQPGPAFMQALLAGERIDLLQLTGSLHLAQWRVVAEESQDGESPSVGMDVRCINAAVDAIEQSPLPEVTNALSVALPSPSGAQVVLVSLCGEQGPEVVETREALLNGDWPDTRTWDLAFVHPGGADDDWALELAPGAHALRLDASDDAFAPVTIPVTVWLQ